MLHRATWQGYYPSVSRLSVTASAIEMALKRLGPFEQLERLELASVEIDDTIYAIFYR
jgi:hypothetical protein